MAYQDQDSHDVEAGWWIQLQDRLRFPFIVIVSMRGGPLAMTAELLADDALAQHCRSTHGRKRSVALRRIVAVDSAAGASSRAAIRDWLIHCEQTIK